MAPEGLNTATRVIEKTDLYSFAVTVLFLTFPADLALKLLFIPRSEKMEIFIMKSLSFFPLLRLIFKSLRSLPGKRINFESWKSLNDLKMNKETEINLSHLNKALEEEGGIYFYILDYFGYDIRSSQVNKNEAYIMSTAISKIQNISLLESKVELSLISNGMFPP